jgi:hypothetical protein
MTFLNGQVSQNELGVRQEQETIVNDTQSKFPRLIFSVKKETSERYLSFFITMAIPFI